MAPVYPVDDNDMHVLTQTVFMEARGEPPEGQAAVVYVIIERARQNKGYWGGRKIADVCKAPYQFECWTLKPNGDHGPEYPQVESLVRSVVYDGAHSNQDDGCDHYNNPSKESAEWTKNVVEVKVIGGHHFYRSKK